MHDDVMGRADGRAQSRHNGSPVRLANMFAIMAGNYLLARSYELATSLGSELTAILSLTCAQVSAGRVRELTAEQVTWSEHDYLRNLERGSAEIYAVTCRTGATLSKAGPRLVRVLADYARNLGVAYQLTNEVAGVSAQVDGLLDHPVARALEDGAWTLPMVLAVGGRGGDELRALLEQSGLGRAELERVLSILRASCSLPRVLELARAYSGRAADALESLPAVPARSALAALVDFVIERATAVAV